MDPIACSPERLAELRAAFNDPNYTPAYCLDGSTTDTQPSVESISLVGILAIGLVIMYLLKES